MANDYSWIEPLGKNAINLFGLNPEDKARGALLQQQKEASLADTDFTRARTSLIPTQKAEIEARTAGHNAKTRKTTEQLDANQRLARILSKYVYTDDRGEMFFDPAGMSEIASEVPHVNVDLKKFAEGLAQLNLNARSRGAQATPAAPVPTATKKPEPATIGEITAAPAPGQPLNLSAGLSALMSNVPSEPQSLDDFNRAARGAEIDEIRSRVENPNNAQKVDLTGVAQLLSGQPQAGIPDNIMRERLARTGKTLSINEAVSEAEAARIRDQNAQNEIAVNRDKPIVLNAGDQAFDRNGKAIATSSVPRALAGGASFVSKDGEIIVTAPKVGGGGSGSSGTSGGSGADGSASTLDVNRSNEWITRAKEVVAEWAQSTPDFPINPGTASQLAAHAYREYFGTGMPNRNPDEVMREYLAKSGLKVDNTAGNWSPASNRTEISQNGRVISGGSDSPIQVQAQAGSAPAAAGTGIKANGKNLMPSPDGSSPDMPHSLGALKPGGGIWTLEDLKPGMFFTASNAENGRFYVFQRQANGTNITVGDATERGLIDIQIADLMSSGFTAFGSDMPKNNKYSENGQVKEYKPYEAVNVRHLLARPTGLGVSEWGIVNRIGTFGQLQNMLRYIAKSETGDGTVRGLGLSSTVKRYYELKGDPNKQMDLLQTWLNNRVAPIRNYYQRELEASRAQKKPESLASNLSDTK
jgi:hypothetical protein